MRQRLVRYGVIVQPTRELHRSRIQANVAKQLPARTSHRLSANSCIQAIFKNIAEVRPAEATWLLFPLGENFPIPVIPNPFVLDTGEKVCAPGFSGSC